MKRKLKQHWMSGSSLHQWALQPQLPPLLLAGLAACAHGQLCYSTAADQDAGKRGFGEAVPEALTPCAQELHASSGAGSLAVRGSWKGLPEEAALQGTTNQVPRVMAEECPRWDLCQLFPAICSAPAWLCNLPGGPLHRQPHRPSQKCWCCLQRLKSQSLE